MALKIAWRNPHPLARTERKLRRISKDQFGAVYAVINVDFMQKFELILGDAA
jgi:hypothetical protein